LIFMGSGGERVTSGTAARQTYHLPVQKDERVAGCPVPWMFSLSSREA
jgi:hypothetical protein